MDKVVLTGSVRDKGTVTSLTVNGEEVLPKSAPLVFFTHVVTLRPGGNSITLAARDAAGNKNSHTFRIERRRPKALLLEERLRLAVFAFEQKGRISPVSFAFQDDFIHALVERRRFQVVERQRLDLILQEQNLSSTDLVDRAAALELGSLAAAHVVVAGSLVETLTGIEIIGRVIESETGTILCTADVYGENKTLPGLKTYARAMALKLHRQFPLVEGRLIEKKGDHILTDLTLEELCAQRRLLIYAKSPVLHRESGRQVGVDYDVLGAARVFQANEQISKARLQSDASPDISPRHFVITQ
jgi:TolB-like protein